MTERRSRRVGLILGLVALVVIGIILLLPAGSDLRAARQTVYVVGTGPHRNQEHQTDQACHPVKWPLTFYVDQPTTYLLKWKRFGDQDISAVVNCRTRVPVDLERMLTPSPHR